MNKVALIISNKVKKIPGGLLECTINPLISMGFNVVWAANFSGAVFNVEELPCSIINVPTTTNPFNIHNAKSFSIINKYIKKNDVEIIFCSTPIGGLLGRLLGHINKTKCVIYQAHGFLFFKNGPKLGFFYKKVEQFLGRYTDFLITINKEDYHNSKSIKLKNKYSKRFLVHGSGLELLTESSNFEKAKTYQDLGIEPGLPIVISIGELNNNKNVKTLIKSAPFIKQKTIFLICGLGKKEKRLKKMSAKNHNHNVDIRFLGYRTDIQNLLSISTIYVSTSKREGLSRTVSEAMSIGIPCIVSNRRGLQDLVDSNGGFLIGPNDYQSLAKYINELETNHDLCSQMSVYNKSKIQNYKSIVVKREMERIFDEAFDYVNSKEFSK